MDPQDRRVKIHREEMESLLNLKSKLDHEEAVSSYAAKYQKLGWVLQALNPQDGTELEVDTGADPETWVSRWWEPGMSGPEINLAVRTGKASRLMVLEVAKGAGEAILDQYGPWRAECIAVLGGGRERHFYAWQPSPLFDSASLGGATEFRWYGEGQVILVPPSIETERLESWEWLCPPWETPPQCPGQSVANFLQHYLTREPQPQPEVSLSWQEVYCLVSPFEPLLQALAASYPSTQSYYQGILAAAATVGLNSPEVLLSLLWHAPRGDARQYPEGLGHLKKLVAAAQVQPNPATFPENVPWKLILDDARSQARASFAGSPGPARFLDISRAQSPQPGGAVRTPFSCRKTRED
ncbi:MAG: bifunctional DNA primase/polymerase [Deltaproteobacteria bacterium]|nr:bifunctional DNA primase/polymerase [Deltaproteobacteria bacterium]